MRDKILALCDTDEEYAHHMTEFLKEHKEAPWEIYTYTDVGELIDFTARKKVDVLLVAENAYTEEVRAVSRIRTILLNESGVMRWSSVKNINKYQQAENVFREIMQEYMDVAGNELPRLKSGADTRLIGMYSPVRRCLQTSFALTMGQMLARKNSTLYLNFEHYAGITELLPDLQDRDLADLVYFLTAEKEKFSLRMQTILRKKGELDYIPPMRAGQNLLSVPASDWRQLLSNIVESGSYKYIILDLTESMQGLFDILRLCSRIFTLTRDDAVADCKILQYEQLLSMCRYEDVLDKTSKHMLPVFHRLPEQIEQLTRGELADYVKKVMGEVPV